MPRYDYVCRLGHKHELVRPYNAAVALCSSCNDQEFSFRQAVYQEQSIITESAPIPLSDRRHNVSRFQEVTQELDYAHTKAENEVGHELPSPNVYKHAMARAQSIDPNVRATEARREVAARARAKEVADAGTHS